MTQDFIQPPVLEPGDDIAVLASSDGIKHRFPATFERGIDRLEERFDLNPVIYDTATRSREWLTDHPEAKAEQIMKAFEAENIKGVIPVTGGDEQLRILQYLDHDRLRDNPTRFYGISDNTNLHIYLWSLGIESYYGGQFLADMMPERDVKEYTFSHLETAFFETSFGELHASDQFSDSFMDFAADALTDDRQRYQNPGWTPWNMDEPVTGRLFGGCFEIVFWQLAAQRFMPSLDDVEGTILALETSEEAPSATAVRRWMNCLGEQGLLDAVTGIIIGRPMRKSLHGESRTDEEKEQYHQDQKDVIKQGVKRYAPDTPVLFDVDFGHTDPKIPLPLGAEITISPDAPHIVC